MPRESSAKKSSKKRKADEPIISDSPAVNTRLKKSKLNNDDETEPREYVDINLTEEFNKISIRGRRQVKSKYATKVPVQEQHEQSLKRNTRSSSKKSVIKEVSEDEEANEDVSYSNQSTATRRTRSASCNSKTSKPAVGLSSATRSNNMQIQSSESIENSSAKKRGRRPKSQQLIDPLTETPPKTPKTPKRGVKRTNSTIKSNQKQSMNKNSLAKIDERLNSESSYNENHNEETRDEDTTSDFEIRIELDPTVEGEPARGTTKPVKLDKCQQVLKKFDDAILNLQEYTLPDKIPCREDEKQTIKDFIIEGVKNQGQSHCLYISGVPGIGKTVSVLEVIKQIQKEYKKNAEFDFNFIHVNGLGLPNPESAYQTILRSITNIKDTSNSTACVILHQLFQKGALPQTFKQYKNELDKRIRVILLDELDYLITKDQNLLYNLFDWPHYKHSKLIIIGIANTMNLPEQLLPKITSRMGNRRLVYKPYTSGQIEKILLSRIENMDIIMPDAITFLSKKIATFSSDIRRTLHVCREALKICREEFIEKYKKDSQSVKEDGLLEISHIRASYNSVYSSPYHECISALMDNSKLLLLAMCLEMKAKAQTCLNLCEVQDRLKGMLNNLGRKPPTHAETKQIFNQLGSLGLVQGKNKPILKKESQAATGRMNNIMDIQVILKISVDDITNSLRNDDLMSKYTDLL